MFHWIVASKNTVRVHRDTRRDYESVIGKPISEATAGTAERWIASMRDRKLAPNTIRTRIASLRTLAKIDYPLPPKHKTDRPVLDAEQVRAILAQVGTYGERLILMGALTRADQIFDTPARVDAQTLTRLIRRYARKAGLESDQCSLRVWRESGSILAEQMTPAEFAELAGIKPVDNRRRVGWRKFKVSTIKA